MKSKIRFLAIWLLWTVLLSALLGAFFIGTLEIGRKVGQAQVALEYTCTPRTATSNIRDDRSALIKTDTAIKPKGQKNP